ncbi:MAG: hypothetical protein PHV30_10260 [Candidatus Margulisbacteria bacterium]|nr:hypothetical protein [Candidatus Margulisiibacteriota bacterium]
MLFKVIAPAISFSQRYKLGLSIGTKGIEEHAEPINTIRIDSIQLASIKAILELFREHDFLSQVYNRTIIKYTENLDMTGHGYHSTPISVGLMNHYQLDQEKVMELLRRMDNIQLTLPVVQFLVIICERLQEKNGAPVKYHIPGYAGDPGVAYADAFDEKNYSYEELTSMLNDDKRTQGELNKLSIGIKLPALEIIDDRTGF